MTDVAGVIPARRFDEYVGGKLRDQGQLQKSMRLAREEQEALYKKRKGNAAKNE